MKHPQSYRTALGYNNKEIASGGRILEAYMKCRRSALIWKIRFIQGYIGGEDVG